MDLFLKTFIVLGSFLVTAPATAEDGLALFWWKEGDFVNFGDYISFKLVERMIGYAPPFYNKRTPNQVKKLLASGSVYYFANEGDVVWGSGVNGKRPDKNDYNFTSLDVRCVRGPITREFLKINFGINAPEIYGDPALLFPYFFPEFKRCDSPENDYIVIVHYLDLPYFMHIDDERIVYATDPWDTVVSAILNSKFVITSSLHGLIIAETYGIPARYLRVSDREPLFKFHDYYQGTGRPTFQYAESIDEALEMGGEPPLVCDLEQIYNAFPFEFWPNRQFPVIDFSKGVSP